MDQGARANSSVLCTAIAIMLLQILTNLTMDAEQPPRALTLAGEQRDVVRSGLKEYKEIDVPTSLFAVDGEIQNEPMTFAVYMLVNFKGSILHAKIQPLAGLSFVVRSDSVWTTSMDSIQSAIRHWQFHSVSSTENKGLVTRRYLEEHIDTCDGETTLIELLHPGHQSSFKYRVYLLVVIRPTGCSVAFAGSMMTIATTE